MNKYNLISITALLILVIGVPVYALREPLRMEQAQADLRQEFVSDAAVIYVENCAVCHGAAGEGIGAMPGLNNSGLQNADYDFLYKTIARGRYDTVMAGWHEDEGGVFNAYQVNELVALIRYGSWSKVGEIAAAQGMIPPTMPIPEVETAMLEEVAALGSDGNIWAEGMTLYATNCTVCHGIDGEGSDLGAVLNTKVVREAETAVLARTISEGVPTTLMVGWSNVFSVDEIDALVAFLQNWDTIANSGIILTAPEPRQIDLNNPVEVLALGEQLFNTTCAVCHGENGSGGIGPVLNSQQILTNKSDQQLTDTIINGGHRPNSSMPAFGDRFTSVEIAALVDFLRAWEPTAPFVENPRGSAQGGGGPPWLRATPDPDNPVSPQGGGQGQGNGNGNGYRGGANPDFQGGQGQGQGQQGNNGGTEGGTAVSPSTSPDTLQFTGEVVSVEGNLLTFKNGINGSLIEAMLGPPRFWSENSIPLNPGDQISLAGFESPDHMELNWLVNMSSGETIQLRQEDGTPVWTE
ncbi:MAG: c-type cytochrome [Chloroflexi bacterium]|nr:c-type cytochrome [Chloroflexota bacterium]